MSPSPLTRRDALRLSALSLGPLSGCLGLFDDYEPGTVAIQNDSNQAHTVTVVFYRFDQELWRERGYTPSFDTPAIPTAEPDVHREFSFEVGPGRSAVERSAITEPLCGAVTMVEIELDSGARYTTHFVSMCDTTAPEGTSDVHLRITITDSDELAVTVLTDKPGAA